VIDFRIYRAGFLPAVVVIVVLLFALQAPPPPLPPVVAPAEFDQASAARIARAIVDKAPLRTPGSSGDAAIADLVQRRFEAAPNAQVAEQRFTGSFDGNDVQLRNLILTLPGTSPRSVVVLASRDSASGAGAASSASATAMMLELAKELGTSSHAKTLIFVSTDGGSDGALGAQEFAAHFPQRDLIDGAIVLWQPGSVHRRQPFVLDASTGPQSASSGLVRTAQRALSDQAGEKPQSAGFFGGLAQLAFPAGLGDQSVLIQRGINAVGLSSAGERPLAVANDQPDDLSASTLGDFGRTALLLAVTLDAAPAPPEHGPGAYVPLAGNLVPGWALAVLALALLLPAAIAAADGLRRAARRGERAGWALWWSASRGLPLLAALLLLYLLGLSGLVARPRFPFDPGRFGIGAGQIVVMALLAMVALAGYWTVRGWRVPVGLGAGAATAALGLMSASAVLVAWLANPYLGLLLVPVAHVWLLDARRGALAWPVTLGAAALSLLPVAAAGGDLVSRLELGSTAPWQLLLLVADGQIGFGAMLALCLLVGCLIGIVALAARRQPLGRRPVGAGARAPGRVGSMAVGPRRALDASPIAPTEQPDDLGEEG
jgi:Peptidase family M28